MDALLQLVPEPLRQRARITADRLARENAPWCRDVFGQAGDVLGSNVARSVTAIAPDLPYDTLHLLTRFSLWLYLLDDRQDDPATDLAALRRLEREVSLVLAGRSDHDHQDVLLRILAEQLAEFAGRGWNGPLYTELVRSVRSGVAAGVRHVTMSRAVAAGSAAAPSVEEYLELGARHVNYRPFALALLIVSAGRIWWRHGHLDRVEAALDYGSLAVRLANDLRSLARERQEGTLNVLLLRIHDLAPVRTESVYQRIVQAMRRHDELLDPVPSKPRDTLVNALRVAIAAYQISDLR